MLGLGLWLWLLSLSPQPAPRTPSDWGTLTVPSRAPLIDARLSLAGGRTLALPRRAFEVQLTASHVNTWAQMPAYFFDGEFGRLDATLAAGLGGGREVWFRLALMRRSGGFLDGFIEGFHRAFGITQARRDRYPRDRLRVDTRAAQGDWQPQLTASQQGVGLGNPTMGLRQQLTPRGVFPVLSVDLCLQLPWGDVRRRFATPGVTLGGRLALEQPLGRRLGLAVAWGLIVSPIIRTYLGVPLTEVQKALLVALMWRPAARWQVVAQYLNHDGISEDGRFRPLNLTTHEFALGARFAPRALPAWVFEAGLIENTVHDANTPDFGIFAGSRLRL